MKIKEAIQWVIKNRSITQKELSKKTGVREAAISNYLNNKSELRSDALQKIVDALGIEVSIKIFKTK